MTVQNARLFIKKVNADATFRRKINNASGAPEIHSILEAEKLSFTAGNFTEAHSNILANSESPEATEDLKALRLWWHFVSA